jgi:predicted peptidase
MALVKQTGVRDLFFLLVVMPMTVHAGSEPELIRRSYVSSETEQERQYFVYLPRGYRDEEQRWPLILFLHGNGERGNAQDHLDLVLAHGPLYEAWIRRRELPFVIVSPQLPLFGRDVADMQNQPVDVAARTEKDPGRWPHHRAANPEERLATPISRTSAAEYPGDFSGLDPYPAGDKRPPDGWFRIIPDLHRIVDATAEEFLIDPDRKYLTGLSYGGFGTFDLAAADPDRWAALAPIVGTGDLRDARLLAASGVPLWIFGGGLDPVVKPHWLYEMAKALELAGHPALRFTVHEDMSHDAWKRVYAGQDLYDWLLSHQKK